MISLWQSACQDTPKRPSARAEDGNFVLTINGNRDNWAAIHAGRRCASHEHNDDRRRHADRALALVADQIFGADGRLSCCPTTKCACHSSAWHGWYSGDRDGQPAVVRQAPAPASPLPTPRYAWHWARKSSFPSATKPCRCSSSKGLPFLQRIWPGKKVAVSVGKSGAIMRAG